MWSWNPRMYSPDYSKRCWEESGNALWMFCIISTIKIQNCKKKSAIYNAKKKRFCHLAWRQKKQRREPFTSLIENLIYRISQIVRIISFLLMLFISYIIKQGIRDSNIPTSSQIWVGFSFPETLKRNNLNYFHFII